MKVAKLSFWIYCEDESEVTELSQSLHEFVEDKRNRGIAVTAKKLSEALKRYGNNYFINQFLK